jgi:hypothetical protein
VSARHQVKRLDPVLVKRDQRFPRNGPAEETGFLRSVRICFGPQFHPVTVCPVRSGPDVFADALVLSRPVRLPGVSLLPIRHCLFVRDVACAEA